MTANCEISQFENYENLKMLVVEQNMKKATKESERTV